MRLCVNPENHTEILVTFDGREPTGEDNDFGADFYYGPAQEIDVGKAVAEIVEKANAAFATRLIAAAPDMLAALKQAVRQADAYHEAFKWVEMARAAIAKAEGSNQ